MSRSIQDLFEWQALRAEEAEERARKHAAQIMRDQKEEDKEIFAFREKEFNIALAKFIAKKSKKAARKRKVTDFLAISSEVDSDAKSDTSERFRTLHAPTYVTPESARLVGGMGDRRIDVYDHAQMHAQARATEAILQRQRREREKNQWLEENSKRLHAKREKGLWASAPPAPQQTDFEWFQACLLADTAYR